MISDVTLLNHLSTSFRGDLRLFCFFVANGSLFAYDVDYEPFLLERRDVFEKLFSVFVNVWQYCDIPTIEQRQPHLDPQFRAKQYLMSEMDRNFQPLPQFVAWELCDGGSELEWKNCVKRFFKDLVHGELRPDLLSGIDYVPELFNCGSTLEGVCAVFSNVLTLDDNQSPINEEHAQFRAAQCVKQWATHVYQPDPPFAGWEVELHLGPVCL